MVVGLLLLVDRVDVGGFAVVPVVLDERGLAIAPEIIKRNKVEQSIEMLVIDRIFEVREELKLDGREPRCNGQITFIYSSFPAIVATK